MKKIFLVVSFCSVSIFANNSTHPAMLYTRAVSPPEGHFIAASLYLVAAGICAGIGIRIIFKFKQIVLQNSAAQVPNMGGSNQPLGTAPSSVGVGQSLATREMALQHPTMAFFGTVAFPVTATCISQMFIQIIEGIRNAYILPNDLEIIHAKDSEVQVENNP
ncbi:MAG: hypothetical protein V4534_08545 [Myxococcota bacterium]